MGTKEQAKIDALKFQREKFVDVIDEAMPLLQRHWKEVARNRDFVPLDIDCEFYKEADAKVMLRIFTVRSVGVLIGYYSCFVRRHPHYKATLFAASDIFWIDPAMRRSPVAFLLFRYAESELSKDGVTVMHTSFKIAIPAPGKILDLLGHEKIEEIYAKVLIKKE